MRVRLFLEDQGEDSWLEVNVWQVKGFRPHASAVDGGPVFDVVMVLPGLEDATYENVIDMQVMR